MRRFWFAVALISTAALGSGCQPQVTACPAIAAAPVVSLTLTASYVPSVKAVHLKACQDGKCHEADLKMRSGSVSVPASCTPQPAGACSSVASPDGTKYGYLQMGSLTASPIQAEVTGTAADGTPLPTRALDFTPTVAQPWGGQCPATITASLLLDAMGLRQQ
ncbi:hypothetical protein [Arthrobacter sp. NyZ413]|uniref:hypothetical protein n=1 Tax=Arthrobacter sp. NyZ413 TaxID=3144669 RepID=UPI003BF83630